MAPPDVASALAVARLRPPAPGAVRLLPGAHYLGFVPFCADSIGSRIISGVGGQMDFIRGASLSAGGRPIIALPSRTSKGTPRIVPTLRPGAGVVTTRAHVHFVVTEHGIADLYGRTLSERARALIAIAHPADREALARNWRDLA